MNYIKKLLVAFLLIFPVLFGSCIHNASGEMIKGMNGYNFSTGNDSYDFNSDYNGEIILSDAELDRLYRQLYRRAISFSNYGTAYMIAILPMSQTVYDRYLPASYSKKGAVYSRLDQIDRYISEKNSTDDNKVLFLNLTGALRSVNKEDGLYDKNDASVTLEGGYYIYKEILGQLPLDITQKIIPIKNPSDISENRYAVMGNDNTVLSTYMKPAFKPTVPANPSLLLNYCDIRDRDALLPYFSSTFGSIGYKQGYENNSSVLDMISPKAVIHVIREDTLHLLWDDEVSLSFEKSLKPGEDPYTTMNPVILETVMTNKNTACIMGTVETDSVITVSGDHFETYTESAQNERFFIDVKIPKNGCETVRLSAKSEGKAESKTTEVYLEYDSDAEYRTVFAGRISQLHYPDTLNDYYGSNLFSEKELDRIVKGMNNRLKSVRKASGKVTKLVYLIAPNALTIYPETATDDMAAKKVSENSRLKQFVSLAGSFENDILIIDLVEFMKSKKSTGKLYYQTDTHWNTLGAYFGYYGLMTALYANSGIKNIAPYELDQFNVYQSIQGSGDLCNFLGVDNSTVSEYMTFCSAKFSLTAVRSTDSSGSEVLRTGNKSLPNAVVMRDSFGAALINFVSEHFNEIIYMSPYKGPDADIIEANQSDYFIQVLVERNLGSLLG